MAIYKTIKRFVADAKEGRNNLGNTTFDLDLNVPMDGTATEYYMAGGYSGIELSSILDITKAGLLFTVADGRKLVYVPWSSVGNLTIG